MKKKAKNVILSFMLGLLSICLCFAGIENPVVEQIAVYGNVRMKDSTVKRIMKIREGLPFEPDMIEVFQYRLERLGIFSHVSIESKTGEEGIILIVTVKERSLFSIKPVIHFGGQTDFNYQEEEEKSFYGAVFGINDFSGRGHHLFVEGGVGGLRKLGLGYRNEALESFTWGMKLSYLWYKSEIYESDVEKWVGLIFVEKSFGSLNLSLWGMYDKFLFRKPPGTDDPDRIYKIGVDMTCGRLDSVVFPSKGINSRFGVYKAFSEGDTIYDRFSLEVSSFFKMIKRHVLALDVSAVFSDGYVPQTDRLFFGGFKTLRCIPIGTYSGVNSVVFSSEYRIPLSRFRMDTPKHKMQGATIYAFLDIGSLTEKMRDIRMESFRANSGLGFFWILAATSGLKLDLSVQPNFRLTVSSFWKF